MSSAQGDETKQLHHIRVWPGVAIVILQWLTRFVVPIILPEALPYSVLGGLLGGLGIIVWWAFFSRAPRTERWSAIVLMIVALVATSYILHESLATAMMGMAFVIYAIPVMCLAFVAWAMASRQLSDRMRRVSMIATILLASGGWTLLRTGGFTGDARHDFAWRWSQTPEDRLLAQTGDEPMTQQSAIAQATEAEWPGFRGPNRDGIIHGVSLETDWSSSPPVTLWQRPIGPGWSSFAVQGDLLYTQEQRGDDEVVACYRVATGAPVWMHRDTARFWEANAGAGPRGTPTLHNGRLYTFGATGILNVLEAGDGAVVWTRNAASDIEAEIPGWGFASSPLVYDDVVIVAVAGTLAAYDLVNGEPRWYGPKEAYGYSSPHLLTIQGTDQVLLMSRAGAISVAPANGTLLWEHSWPGGHRIVQPALIADGSLLISESESRGTRRLTVSGATDGWTVHEQWTSNRLKPNFNDFVVHEGHAFGFDGTILACMDIADGSRKWKGGRYGAGQLLLLADQDVLLVLSEKGELALVSATPDKFVELAKSPAIKGKTWNHPILAGDVLLVRNSQEMAAFRLSLKGD